MSRPPQRFVIRRISIGAKTTLPWTLTDTHRPSHIGRHPTMTAALAEAQEGPHMCKSRPLRCGYRIRVTEASLTDILGQRGTVLRDAGNDGRAMVELDGERALLVFLEAHEVEVLT